jgi:exonuclease 3'-5' domain-containing protein 1
LRQSDLTLSRYLFDFVEGGTEMFNWGLREILEGTEIMKILHDCRWDSDILWTKHNVKLNNVFDTQVAFCVYTRFASLSRLGQLAQLT